MVDGMAHILITGGTGFIGRALCKDLLDKKHDITVLSRTPDKVSSVCGQQAKAIGSLDDIPKGTPVDAIINLAGAPIADARWTLKRKIRLLSSRITTTRQILDLIDRLEMKPEVLVSASAVGYYGDQGDTMLDEESGYKDDFAHQLCAEWERTARQAEAYSVRVCLLRIGLVIGPDGGFLKKMILPFKLGLGGRLGNGKQWMSWVHRDDLINMLLMLLERPALSGTFNGTAPNPVTNREFTQTLAKCLHRPAFLPVPAPLLKLALGEMSILLLGGQRVIPKRFQAERFDFRFETLDHALDDVLEKS